MREAAWNYLTDAEKEELIKGWKNAEVAETSTDELPVVKNGGGAPEVVGQLYKVTFGSKMNEVLGAYLSMQLSVLQ